MRKNPFTFHRFQHAYRRLIAGVALITVATLPSCQNDEIILPVANETLTRAAWKVEKPGGLIQQADGTWKTQNCRVPLVGPGRIVNDINEQVEVITVNTGKICNIIDTNLNNHYSAKAVVSAGLLYTPITSVKDLHRVYAGGEKVGFVYKDEAGKGISVLSLDLLKSLSLTTYLKGKKQETSIQSQGGSTLKLDLLAVNSNSNIENRIIAFTTTKPFDEVVLGTQGVKAQAASTISLAIKYAFVGENPEIRATSEEQFKNYWTGGAPIVAKDNVANGSYITDSDTTNSAKFTSEVLFRSYARINLKKEIPVGSELGFCYKLGKLLDLTLLGTDAPELTTYDSNTKELENSNPPGKLLGLGLIGGNTNKTFINIEVKKPCTQIMFEHPKKILDLGGMSVFYAYVREGVKLDPSNEFTFGNDTTYSVSYTLPVAEQGSVDYQVLSSPYGSKPTISTVGDKKILDGITHDGSYRIQALYTARDGRQMSHIATIYRKTETRKKGNIYITAHSHGAYAVEPKGWKGSLLSLFHGQNNLNNVVDNIPTNFAIAYKLANVLEFEPVAAFQLNKPIGGNGQKIRTGFVAKAQNHLLDLTALTFFQIKLYSGNELVYQSGSTKNSTVKLGLLGSDNNKVRLSVVTDREFDRIELWQKGVASVLDNIRLYHLFYEDSSCDATTEVGGGFELLTNVKDGLMVDYERTSLSGLLAVGEAATNLSNMLDGSIASGTVLRKAVGSGEIRISLTFKKKAGNQPVGIILGEMPNLVDVTLVDIGILRVFNDDKEVASTKNFGVLGADLISHNGRTYIEVTPEEEFNRIEFTTASVLSLLENSKICGVYCRNVESERGNTDNSLIINDGIYHACYGSDLNIPVKTTLTPGTTVSLYCEDIKDATHYRRINAEIGTGMMVIPATEKLAVGQYKVIVYNMEGQPLTSNEKLFVAIHPLVATWKSNAPTTDWNSWDNWIEGSPWSCTDVIIPSAAIRYPELKDEKNPCANIHFESGAEVVGTQYLTMEGKAYVDLSLQGGSRYLLSAPLQEMYTGDMFVNSNVGYSKEDYFIPLNAENYPEQRTSPVVYQRFWSRSAIEKVIGANGQLSDIEVGTAQWSDEFNAVAEKYENCQGFSLRAGETDDFNGYTFRFPKTHDTYHYYTHEGTVTDKAESVARTNTGKLNALPGSITLTNQEGNTFLMGNPMMCHLDIAKFLQANPEIAHITTNDNNTYNATIKVGRQLISSQTTSNPLIAPMEAFFIVTKTATGTLSVTLNEDMFCQKANTKTTVRKASRSAQPLLRITAATNGEAASCVVVRTPEASDEYRTGEDAPLMIDGEERPAVAIYTSNGNKALSIQQINEETRIPLGLLMKQSCDIILLFETNDREWNDWQLVDNSTGKSYPLNKEIRLENVGNGSNRFYLNKKNK